MHTEVWAVTYGHDRVLSWIEQKAGWSVDVITKTIEVNEFLHAVSAYWMTISRVTKGIIKIIGLHGIW